MLHDDLRSLIHHAPALPPGPVAVILCADDLLLEATLRHHLALGFDSVLVLMAPHLAAPALDDTRLHLVRCDAGAEHAMSVALSALAPALAPRWVFAAQTAEFLFYPYCTTRPVPDLLDYLTGERRASAALVTVDLYAEDLKASPDGTSLTASSFDRVGYFSAPRRDAAADWQPMERQSELYGGLRWRYEDHVPHEQRRIDRPALVRAARGLRLNSDLTWSMPEANTRAGPWHRALTGAVVSFRAAIALCRNPGARACFETLCWPGSERFDWTPAPLLRHGLMEPGQWA